MTYQAMNLHLVAFKKQKKKSLIFSDQAALLIYLEELDVLEFQYVDTTKNRQ